MTYDVIDLKDAPKRDSGNLVGGMGTVKAEKLGLLWSFAIEDALTSAANSSAFQLALWMIQYGEDLSYSSVNSSIKTMAESWVYTVDSIHGTGGYEAFVADFGAPGRRRLLLIAGPFFMTIYCHAAGRAISKHVPGGDASIEN